MAKLILFRPVAILYLLIATGTSAIAQQVPPNILLLVAEDMGPRVGAFGDPVAKTPTLDKLAQQSLRYPNTFTTAGVCAPSRAALITGVNQVELGAQHMRTSSSPIGEYLAVPPPEVKAFPELLRKAGYYTYITGKLDYQFSRYGANTGPLTIWDKEGVALDWLPDKLSQPFFGMYHFGITHESRTFDKHYNANLVKQKVQDSTAQSEVKVPPYYPDTKIVRRDISRIYNNIQTMDFQVGKLLDQLESRGLSENTIVIWTTDHGDGLPRAKRELYDSGINVPLIVHTPKRYRSSMRSDIGVDNQLISFVDIAPSILSMAEVPTPFYMDGKARLTHSNAPKREYIYAAKDRLDEHLFRERAVRSKQYKLIRNYLPNKPGAVRLSYREQQALMGELWRYMDEHAINPAPAIAHWFNARPEYELYDVSIDPHEINNLAAKPDYANILRQMQGALNDWQSRVLDKGLISESTLRQEFWPGGKQPVTAAPTVSRTSGGAVALTSHTEGASLAYQFEGEDIWRVYTLPFTAPKNGKVLAKAVRYGYGPSEVVVVKATR
ncbi:sulfatase-like hydrolase/transferase [Gilvimarinus sp. SDUM040013]|uniref:Sulfatase-like hydrolase/transferase n=1 Tax=Gilvimarinus gilvus TaxID=3058038 RepID=A0ABU4S0B6_9GAMM|nr:sulfatase-like hydrolase/transferase [Gilvimarinus sp. SDUM040013]MDO3385617.1 sulfatase-like hydrolase/transferase [Gilvimarinus sp. SDUM040013]MDX6849951.1 sulfatase-like hydrolase/transferase [Gilvimarinus sp. SDUM040013]